MLLTAAGLVGTSCRGSDAPPAACGDGVWEHPTEGCDDGNTFPGDGCGADCEPEEGWSCGFDGGCRPICGDGQTAFPERCDDGNTVAGDGCSADCQMEAGWYCTSPAGLERGLSTCGRQRETGEECRLHDECLSDRCSHVDESDETTSICIAGQGEPCTSDSCPFHTWVDENGTLHEGGCVPRRFGRGICLTGCWFSVECPPGWFCGSWRDEVRGARCRQACNDDADCVGENDWCAAGSCFGTDPMGAPATE